MSTDVFLDVMAGAGGRIVSWEVAQPGQSAPGAVRVSLEESIRQAFFRDSRGFRVEGGAIVPQDPPYIARGSWEIQAEMQKIQEEMDARDYQQLKYLRGRLTEEEWARVVAWYDDKTEAYNALEALLRVYLDDEDAAAELRRQMVNDEPPPVEDMPVEVSPVEPPDGGPIMMGPVEQPAEAGPIEPPVEV